MKKLLAKMVVLVLFARPFPLFRPRIFSFTLLYKYPLVSFLQFAIMYSPEGNKPNGSGKHPAMLFNNMMLILKPIGGKLRNYKESTI